MAGYIGSKIAVTQVDGYNRTEADAEFVNDPNAVITVSGSNVGIGTSSPTAALDVRRSDTDGKIAEFHQSSGYGFDISSSTSVAKITSGYNQAFVFETGTTPTERMRIDSSGNLLVGKTSSNGQVQGCELRDHGQAAFTNDGGNALQVRRLSSDGEIIQIVKDVTQVGAIGVNAGYIQFYSTASGTGGIQNNNNGTIPVNSSGSASDNTRDLGQGNYRWDDVYATNGTIQTSDRNEKQDIEALSDAEQRVAVAAKGLLRKYRWKDAVAEKGDTARIHFGIIAQDLQAAFEAEGLDAGRYGMFISSTWWEAEVEKTREVEQEDGTTITETYTATETYDEPTEGATERTRLGVRYPELLAFIIAAL